MNRSIPLIVFIVVCFIDLLGIYLGIDILVYIAKPLLMITLFWYYYMNARTLNTLFIWGLVFSFLGDILLIGEGEVMFILGLLFFLIAHIFYIMMVLKWLQRPTITMIFFASIPYALIFIALMNILYRGLGEMRIPVIVYAITISLFGIASLIHYFQNRKWRSIVLVAGVIIFILSDAILALNLFYEPRSYYPIMIMTTYVLAQYLICRFVLIKNASV